MTPQVRSRKASIIFAAVIHGSLRLPNFSIHRRPAGGADRTLFLVEQDDAVMVLGAGTLRLSFNDVQKSEASQLWLDAGNTGIHFEDTRNYLFG